MTFRDLKKEFFIVHDLATVTVEVNSLNAIFNKYFCENSV